MLPKLIVHSIAALALSLAPLLSGAARAEAAPVKTVVLVHGAFADGSSWQKVIALLQAKGFKVVAVQNPLSSLAADVAATQRALALQKGPVILVGHSWGGTVITEAGLDDKVAGLVYVAAMANDAGQTYIELSKAYPMPPGSESVKLDSSGFVRLTTDGFIRDFANDLLPAEAAVLAAVQGPIFGKSLEETVSNVAWKKKPSWYVVAANDRMLDPQMQRAMAVTIKARTTVLDSGHAPMLSQPEKVAEVIEDAANNALPQTAPVPPAAPPAAPAASSVPAVSVPQPVAGGEADTAGATGAAKVEPGTPDASHAAPAKPATATPDAEGVKPATPATSKPDTGQPAPEQHGAPGAASPQVPPASGQPAAPPQHAPAPPAAPPPAPSTGAAAPHPGHGDAPAQMPVAPPAAPASK